MSVLAGRQSATTDRPAVLPHRHGTRLRHYWRSHGWACHDNIDIDLLRWGLITEASESALASCFVLTDDGRAALGDTVVHNRKTRSRHAQVVDGVAGHLAGLGRLVFTELSVHTVDSNTDNARWAPCKPDVFSLTRSLRPDHLAPQVHEIKVRRSDLLGELRSAKIERYRELAAEVYFVIVEGIARPDEIPSEYGVIVWREEGGYTLARAARVRDYKLETRHWMAMARARPFMAADEPAQLSF